MERLILAFHKEVFRIIKFLFVVIPAKLGLVACVTYLALGTLINFIFMIDKPLVKMYNIGASLLKEESTEGDY